MSTKTDYDYGGLYDVQGDVLTKCFYDLQGQLVAGNVSSFLDLCAEAGGGIVSSPCTKSFTDVPVYLCATLPKSTTLNVSRILRGGHNDSDDWVVMGVSSGNDRTPCSKSCANALLPSKLGAWWFIPLLGSVALAVIS